jgi:hypothetical protein
MTRTHVVPVSKNAKTGPMAATYRTQDSCPTTCPLLGNGCYAESGPGGGPFRMVAKHGRDDLDALRALRYQLPRGGWLRLNVSGDFLTDDGTLDTDYVDACNELVRRRPDLNVLAYTHAWRQLDPAVFDFTVNASCETPAELEAARAAGWMTVVVDPGGDDSLIGTTISGARVAQCPQQYRPDVTCARCGACAANKRTRPTIAFTVHGSRKKTAAAIVTTARTA